MCFEHRIFLTDKGIEVYGKHNETFRPIHDQEKTESKAFQRETTTQF